MKSLYDGLIERLISLDNNYLNQHLFKLVNDLYLFYITNNFTNFKKIKDVLSNAVIIGGCARSGTTFLLAALSSHPKIHAIPYETGYFFTIGTGTTLKSFSKLPNRNIRIRKLYKYIFDNKIYMDDLKLCEKSPNNIQAINKLLEYFGKSLRFINIVRDGRDVITSIHPNHPEKYWVKAERWINCVKIGIKYENHPQVLTIRYEDLVLDFEITMAKVCEFVGIDYSNNFDDVINSSKLKIIHGQKIVNPHSNSIGRWKNSKYIDLIDNFAANPESEKLLRHYDYI